MQTRERSHTRGASILGVVVLLSLLSVGAIALDSGSSQDSMSQVAGVEVGAKEMGAKSAENDAEAIKKNCQVGYDYLIKVNEKGEVGIHVLAIGKDDQAVEDSNISAGNRCPNQPGVPRDGIAGRSCQSPETPGRVATQKDWFCRFSVCRQEKGKKEACRISPWQIKVGEAVQENTDKAEKEATKDAGKTASDSSLPLEKRKEAADFLPTTPLSDENSPLSAYDEQTLKNNTEIKDRLNGIEQTRSALEGYQKQGADGKCTLPQQLECSLLEQREKSYDSRIRDLTAQNKELLDKKELEAKKLPPNIPAVSYCVTSCYPLHIIPNKHDSSCLNYNKSDFGCESQNNGGYNGGGGTLGGGNNALTAACQGGNQQACQALAGNGGMPSGAPSQGGSQRCSSSNSSGGLIGTIVSLFKKDNNSSNCVNGMLVPTCTLTASPQNIPTPGQSAQLMWQSQNAYSASLSNAGNIPPQGSMTVNPQSNTTYSMFVQGARNQQTGQQLSGQCSIQVTIGNQGGTNDGAPEAEISCGQQPLILDVGMSVPISFSCKNLGSGAGMGTSAGTGFSTNGAPSGSATPVIQSPQLGSNNTVTYGLTCSKQGKTDTAQCTVQINRPWISLVAIPEGVKSGEEANIGWITNGMEECTVSSPTLNSFTAENANNTSVSGVAKTPPLTQDASFVLSCTTKAGGTKNAEIEVKIGEDL